MADLAAAPQLTDDTHSEALTPPQPAPAVKPPREWGRTVARQASTVSSKLAPLVTSAGGRVATASPMTLLVGLLGLLTILAIVASVSFDNSLGVTSAVLFVPLLSAAVGALLMRCFADRHQGQVLHEEAREEASRLRQVEHTLDYVDTKLTTALTQFGTDSHNEAVIAMFQAKAATELCGDSTAPERNSAVPVTPASDYQLGEMLAPTALLGKERTAGLSLI